MSVILWEIGNNIIRKITTKPLLNIYGIGTCYGIAGCSIYQYYSRNYRD